MKSMLFAAALMGIFVFALFSEQTDTAPKDTQTRYVAPLDIPEVTAFAHRVRMAEIGLFEVESGLSSLPKKEKLPVCVFFSDTAQ